MLDLDVFLCDRPLSPPSPPFATSDAISPITFQPLDDLFPLTPPQLNPVSPILRFRPPLTPPSPLTPLSSPSPSTPLRSSPQPIYTFRSLQNLTQSPEFPLLYRRFPASSFYSSSPTSDPCILFNPSHPGGSYNPPRFPLDLYTPRFVRGKGHAKQGLCPICVEPRARGGSSQRLWLSMKFSAFNYHMQYHHGISASTGRPFAPPLAFRISPRPNAAKNERSRVQEAQCHKCRRWVPVQGVKDVQLKVKELFWWKHAAVCHGSSSLDASHDVYEHDSVYAVLSQL